MKCLGFLILLTFASFGSSVPSRGWEERQELHNPEYFFDDSLDDFIYTDEGPTQKSAKSSKKNKAKPTESPLAIYPPVPPVNSTGNFSIVEDKSTGRACPACVGGECSGNVQLTGLPIIQVLVALGAGLIIAVLFIWIYKHIYEDEDEVNTNTGYGYGKPMQAYGLPPPSHSYGRKISNYLPSVNKLTKFVLDSIEKYEG